MIGLLKSSGISDQRRKVFIGMSRHIKPLLIYQNSSEIDFIID